MYISHVAAGGLFLAFLALGLDGKPAPQSPPQKTPSGNAAALGRELAELLEASSGPAAAGAARSGGTKPHQQPQPQAPKGKGSPSGASSSSASRLMRDLRTDTKQSRAAWARLAHPEHHAGGGGGGGGGGSRRFKGKKGLVAKGCFGLKLDRIGSMSGLGC